MKTKRQNLLMKYLALAALACIAAGNAGCAQNTVAITVASDIPVPVTDRLPLRVGVYYDEAFARYVYEEDSEDRPDWRIDSGASQVALFDQVLATMFQELRRVDSMQGGPDLDIVIAPKVEDMQFSTPTEVKSDFYEAWIRYDMAIFEADGDPITNWRFEGYGKSSTEFLKDDDKGMNEAINVALRDAGAKMVVKFREIPEIKTLVEEKKK